MQHPTFRRGIAAAALLVSVTLLAQDSGPKSTDPVDDSSEQITWLVKLPELKVTEAKPWLYAEVEGYRVLSLCTEKQTRATLEGVQAQLRAVPLLISPATRKSPPTRPLLILSPKPDTPSKSIFGSTTQTFMCEDTFVIFHEVAPEDSKRLFRRNFVRATEPNFLSSRIEWIVARSAFCPDFGWYGGTLSQLGRMFERATTNTVRFSWSLRFTKLVSREDGIVTYAPLIPLGEYFNASQNPSLMNDWSKDKRGLAQNQGTLFAHWAVMHKNGRRSRAFHSFFEAAGREPITEALFQRHFGLTYDIAEKELDRVLRKMEFYEIFKIPVAPPEDSGVPLLIRAATPAQIHTALGEAYALAGERPYRRSSPVHQLKARGLLEETYRLGDRSAELMGLLGLLEYGAARYRKSLEYLDAAVDAGSVRPRALAYTSLLRLAYAAQRPEGTNRTLSARQTARVLEPLEIARQQFPEMEMIGRISAETFIRSQVAPTREQLVAMHDTALRFRYRAELLRVVAKLHRRHGLENEALVLERLANAWKVAPPSSKDEIDQLFDHLDLFKPLSTTES